MKKSAKGWFAGRRLLIATKHGKEAVIAPVFESKFGVQCVVPDDYDTDQFGTFTGEISRVKSPLETVRQKCETAMLQYGFDLAIASEGSFGVHPTIGFVPCNDELLVLLDFKNKFEMYERELSVYTNLGSAVVQNEAKLIELIEHWRFPQHGLIVSIPGTEMITKGIIDQRILVQTYRNYRKISDKVNVETDMRAMYNPTRMEVIEKAAVKLAERVNSSCPQCELPGFGITEAFPGLPCEICARPTKSTLALRYACNYCGHHCQLPNPDRKTEDPTYCDYCNP